MNERATPPPPTGQPSDDTDDIGIPEFQRTPDKAEGEAPEDLPENTDEAAEREREAKLAKDGSGF